MAYNRKTMRLREASALKLRFQTGPNRSRLVQAGPDWIPISVVNVKKIVVEEILLMAECFWCELMVLWPVACLLLLD